MPRRHPCFPHNHTYSKELISLITHNQLGASSIGYCLFRPSTVSSNTPESLHFTQCMNHQGPDETRESFYLTYIALLLSFSQEEIEEYKLSFIQEFNSHKFKSVDPWDSWKPERSVS